MAESKEEDKSSIDALDAEKPPSHCPNGKFAKGNKCGKGGDAHAAKILAYRKTIFAAVSAADVRDIVKKAVEQAKEGDKYAREFLFERLMGKAVAHVEASLTENLKQFIGIDLDKV